MGQKDSRPLPNGRGSEAHSYRAANARERSRFWLAVAVIAITSGALAVTSALKETQTWDEGIHISAGYAYLTRGDYRWNQEHPPLAKLMSALPLTFFHLKLPVRSAGWKKLDETQVGIDFLYDNRAPADSILFAARSMTILLTVLFVAGVALWARPRFGPGAALLAAALCAFDPNLIAHGRYVTTDFPVTVFFFFAAVFWTDYLWSGRRRELVVAAFAFALAMVTKFSAVLLIPALAALYGIRWVQSPREFPLRRAAVAAGMLAGVTLLAVCMLYWPETLRCFATGDLGSHPFLTGFEKVMSHNQVGQSSYLMGVRSEQGWWYYFPAVFAVKSTVAALAATALLIASGIWAIRKRPKIVFGWWGLLIPPLVYFSISMTSAINIGMRHILPVYPFLYVATAALLAGPLPNGRGSVTDSEPRPLGSGLLTRKTARYAMVALGGLQLAECASITPDYLAFFNALSGGPGNGPHYVVDSNIDWGQDVKKLAQWLRAHGTHSAYVLYFGNAQMPYYGIDAKNFPDPLDEQAWDKLDGFAVAAVTPLNGVYVSLDHLARLRLREPVAKIGWSMYVYDFRKRPGP